jgi:tetratricopeptide (TPR) repeat protein
MTEMRKVFHTSTFLVWSILGAQLAADDALARAKDLYTAAAYDEALAALNDYHSTSPQAVEADEYRAFCLLALGKLEDATKVIEQIVTLNPSFHPSDAQASPRTQEQFRNVRRRALPKIARQSYTEAKAAFSRSDFDLAAKQFERVVVLLADADVADSGDLADLRLLSKEFGELIQKQLALAAPRPAPAARSVPADPSVPAKEPPEADRIYGIEDSDVTPPSPISQAMPPWHPTSLQTETWESALTIVVDEAGNVASIHFTGALWPPYETMLRQNVGRWKYRPALKNGRPVKYRKTIAIRLQPNEPHR